MSNATKQQTTRWHAKDSSEKRRVPSLRHHKATGQAYAVWFQNSAVPEYRPELTLKSPFELSRGHFSAQRHRRFTPANRPDLENPERRTYP